MRVRCGITDSNRRSLSAPSERRPIEGRTKAALVLQCGSSDARCVPPTETNAMHGWRASSGLACARSRRRHRLRMWPMTPPPWVDLLRPMRTHLDRLFLSVWLVVKSVLADLGVSIDQPALALSTDWVDPDPRRFDHRAPGPARHQHRRPVGPNCSALCLAMRPAGCGASAGGGGR